MLEDLGKYRKIMKNRKNSECLTIWGNMRGYWSRWENLGKHADHFEKLEKREHEGDGYSSWEFFGEYGKTGKLGKYVNVLRNMGHLENIVNYSRTLVNC